MTDEPPGQEASETPDEEASTKTDVSQVPNTSDGMASTAFGVAGAVMLVTVGLYVLCPQMRK